VESPQLKKIFLLLRQDLQESDIPGRTTIRKHIDQAFNSYIAQLKEKMAVLPVINFIFRCLFLFLQKSVGKISFTTDTWSDPNQASFMAVTAHWIEVIKEGTPTGSGKKLQLRADLIGFHKIPGRHTGAHFAYCFLFIINRLKIASKVSIHYI
jgi:hypothetical protein